MKVFMMFAVIVVASCQQCRREFEAAKDCMQKTIKPHFEDITQQDVDRLKECVKTEAKACVQTKLGPLAGVLQRRSGDSDPVKSLQVAQECALTAVEPYAEDFKDCLGEKYPDVDIDERVEEFKAKMKDSRKTPQRQAAFLCGAIIKLEDKLDCSALEQCAADVGINLSQLKRDVCAAKQRCRNFSNECKQKAKEVKENLCQCYDEVKEDVPEGEIKQKTLSCMESQGVTVPKILQNAAARRGGDSDQFREKICGDEFEDMFDGSNGLCAEEKTETTTQAPTGGLFGGRFGSRFGGK